MNANFGKKLFSLFSVLLVLLVGASIYSNTFNVPFQFDDRSYLLNNPTLEDFDHIDEMIVRTGLTRLLPYLSFALNYRLHGYEVFGYHLINLIIHLINGILVWLLTKCILRTPRIAALAHDNNGWLPLAVALIFIAHPLQTQAVTYIYQRIASLATLFYLLCVISYLLARMQAPSKAGRWIWFGASLLAAVCGLLSKQITITLPLMIIVMECFLFPLSARPRRLLSVLAAVAIPLVLFIPIVYRFDLNSIVLQKIEPGAYVPGEINWWSYALTQTRVLLKYFSLIVFPYGQSIDHYFELSMTLKDWRVWAALGAHALIMVGAWRLRVRLPLVTLGVLWFYMSASVESGIIPIANVIFEHRMYLPSFGWALLIATLLRSLARGRREFVALVLILTSIYGVLTYQRNKVWKDETTLWSDAIEKAPKNPRPYYNLGYSYMKKGNNQMALRYYSKALALKPDYYYALNNRSNLYSAAGESELAFKDISAAIQSKPGYGFLYNSRGTLYQKKGDCELAIEDFTKGIELEPEVAGPYINRGICYGQQDKYELALIDLNKAIDLDPDFAESYNNRGAVYLGMKDHPNALTDFNKAIQLAPRYLDALYNRAITYAAVREGEKAIADFSAVLEIDPKNFKALQSRAILYQQIKDYVASLADFNRAITLEPQNSALLKRRAFLFMLMGRLQEALADYNVIIKNDPSLAQVYIERAKLYYKIKEYAKAKADFDLALSLEPGNKEAYFLRALMAYEMNDPQQALADLKKAKELGHPIEDRYLQEFEKAVEQGK